MWLARRSMIRAVSMRSTTILTKNVGLGLG
jgi:hypothetical protein